MFRKLDDDAYSAALRDFEQGPTDTAIWARALAESNGNELAAKSQYIAKFAKKLSRSAPEIARVSRSSQWVKNTLRKIPRFVFIAFILLTVAFAYLLCFMFLRELYRDSGQQPLAVAFWSAAESVILRPAESFAYTVGTMMASAPGLFIGLIFCAFLLRRSLTLAVVSAFVLGLGLHWYHEREFFKTRITINEWSETREAITARFLKLRDSIKSVGESFLEEMATAGYSSLFEANRIKQDRDLSESRQIIASATKAVEATRIAHREHIQSALNDIAVLSPLMGHTADRLALLDQLGTANEEAMDVFIDLLKASDAVIQYLADTPGWSVTDDALLFQADENANEFNRLMEKVQSLERKVSRLGATQVLPDKERFERVAEGVRDNEQNLIWAERDNGSDINWTDAGQYCAARGAGWSLPMTAALQSLYDASGKYPQVWIYKGDSYTLKPSTPLIGITSCCFWSNEQNGNSEAWYVSLLAGHRYATPVGHGTHARALCVRES